ncbi:hypothetical protein [Pedobacter sp. WC2423]|uniref:hypothetical protein n=1 Tax=Pedobacter sp. WC2423 TaxID=3234142 RepID=UPI003465C97B
MNNESEKQPDHKNEHQDLSKEHLGNEPEEQTEGDPDSPYRLKGLEDKRPEDSNIKKGWAVDSNTSRRPQETDDH